MYRTLGSTALFALATALAVPAAAQDATPSGASVSDTRSLHDMTLAERREYLKEKRARERAAKRDAAVAGQRAERRARIAKRAAERGAAASPAQAAADTEETQVASTDMRDDEDADDAPVSTVRTPQRERTRRERLQVTRGPGEPDPRDDIIVTALLRDETIADAASSTSVATGETIDALGGVGDQGDLVDLLPGVNFADNGGINSEITIRGAGGMTAQSNDTDSAVAILRNGARVTGGNLGGKSFSRMDSFDLGQAEVVRGPEGALYGANAVGGVINLVSNRPKFRNGASAEVQYKPDVDELVQSAILNLAASRKLAFRFGYQGDKRDGGFFYNRFFNRFGDSANDQLGRVSMYWKPSPAFSNLLIADYEFQRTPPGPVKTLGATDLDGPFVYGHNTFDTARKRELSINNNLEWNTGIGKITSITAYRWRDTSVLTDSDGSYPGYTPAPVPAAFCTLGLCTRSDNDKTSTFSEEVRLDIKGSRRFDMIVGGNIQLLHTDSFTLNDGRETFRNPTVPNATANTGLVSNRRETQLGLFASMEWKPVRGLTIDGAARYNRSDKRGSAYTVQRQPAGVTTPCNYQSPEGVTDPACISKSRVFSGVFSNVSPSLSVKYKVTPKWSVYASVARGYRPGGFNSNANDQDPNRDPNDPIIPSTYQGETTTAYELGTKWRWRKMLLSLSGFYNKYDNLLVVGIPSSAADAGDINDTSAYYRFNAGEAHNYGFDAELQGDLPIPSELGKLQIDAALNYVTGRITSGPYVGQSPEGSPEWTTTFSAIWSKPIGGGWKITASGSYRGEHGGFAKTSKSLNNVFYPPKDVVKMNLALENRQWRFAVTADNVLDNVYITRATPRSSIYADRRIVAFRASYAFGSEKRRR